MSVRFKTQFRGAEIDVEMELLHGPNPAFAIAFHDNFIPDPPLTRKELARLCREAGHAAKKQEAN